MKKLGKDKIALFFACISSLGFKTHAMDINKAQSQKSIGTVRGGENST